MGLFFTNLRFFQIVFGKNGIVIRVAFKALQKHKSDSLPA